MSVLRCDDCRKPVDTDFSEMYMIEQKYFDDREICKSCMLKVVARNEALEKLRAEQAHALGDKSHLYSQIQKELK